MRKKVFLIASMILSLASFGEERTAYILVPSSLALEDVKVTGIVKDGGDETNLLKDVTAEGDTLLTLDELRDSEEIGVVVQNSSMSSYGDTKYVEVVVANIEGGDDVKFAMGYPLDGREIPTYTYIASSDVKDNSTIDGNFHDESIMTMDVIDATDFTYDTFPGYELTDDVRISGFVVGEEEMDSAALPSNIVDIYSKNGELEDAINKVIGGAAINPTNSDKNSEFELWAVKTDENGDVIPTYDENDQIIYRQNQDGSYALDKDGNKIPEGERVLLFTSKDSGEENPLYIDLRNIKSEDIGAGEQFYPSGSYPAPFDNLVFDIDVRFKNANGETININNEDVPIGLGTGSDKYKWQFYNMEDVTLTFYGGNNIYFNFKGDSVGIIPPDGSDPSDIPLPVAEELYVIEDTGDLKEREAELISKYQGTERKRTTNVKMKVMTSTGSGEKNFEIETMEE